MPLVRLLLVALLLLVATPASVGADKRFWFDMSEASIAGLRIGGCTVEPTERSGKPAYRMKGEVGADVGMFAFKEMPRDLTPYRWLRFHMRGTPGFPESCIIAFVAKRKSLLARVPGPTNEWQRVEVALPGMRCSSQFDPKAVERLHLGFGRKEGYTVEIAGVELVKGRGGWRHTALDEKTRLAARKFTVEDFERMPRQKVTRSKASTIYTEKPRGHALRWLLPSDQPNAALDFTDVPKQLKDYRILRFRARAPTGIRGEFRIRFRSAGGIIESRIPHLEEEWQQVEIHIPDMTMQGTFDPAGVRSVRLACFDTQGGQIDFDDFEIEKGQGGWRYSAKESFDLGLDAEAPFYRISNFEGLNAAGRIDAKNSKCRIVTQKKGRQVEGHYLRWTVKPNSDDPWVTFIPVPKDIRPYRRLRFRIRVDKQPADRLKVCFQGKTGSLRTYLKLTPGEWETLEFNLPDMKRDASFDPKDSGAFRFLYYGDRGFNLDLDDIEILKGAGGSELSEEEQVASIFGKERARKVKKKETKHFHIWTDTSAVSRKFHDSLEKMHFFVCAELGIEAPPDKLAVYIFQNPDLYFDFCERKGWTRAEAKVTSGHSDGSYFATYYQAPGAPTVAHELTHSIVHCTLGTGGGAWFQEGIAVYLESRWRKRSAAGEFAPRLRSDQFVPLAEFLQIPKLVRETDLTGGPRQAGWLYAQAGAFFEFLRWGPHDKSAHDRLQALSVLNVGRPEVVGEVERILGQPIDKVQAAWIEWGSKPPKPGRR